MRMGEQGYYLLLGNYFKIASTLLVRLDDINTSTLCVLLKHITVWVNAQGKDRNTQKLQQQPTFYLTTHEAADKVILKVYIWDHSQQTGIQCKRRSRVVSQRFSAWVSILKGWIFLVNKLSLIYLIVHWRNVICDIYYNTCFPFSTSY